MDLITLTTVYLSSHGIVVILNDINALHYVYMMSALHTLQNNQVQLVGLSSAGSDDDGRQFFRFIDEVFNRLPHNSKKALVCDWRVYVEYCRQNNLPPTSGNNETASATITGFLADQAVKVKANTLTRRLSSLRKIFSIMKVANPLITDDVLRMNIKYTTASISAPAKQAVPLNSLALEAALQKLDLANITQLRAAVMLSLAYDTMARASEIRMVKVEHISRRNGAGLLLIERSKTDRVAVGSYRYISNSTMALIDRWLTHTGISAGYLFRKVAAKSNAIPGKTKKLNCPPISYDTVLRVYKMFGGEEAFTAHSTRVGSTLDQISANIPNHKIQMAGGWKNTNMVTYYGRMLDAEESGAAMLAKLSGR